MCGSAPHFYQTMQGCEFECLWAVEVALGWDMNEMYSNDFREAHYTVWGCVFFGILVIMVDTFFFDKQ